MMQIDLVVEYGIKQWFCSFFLVRGRRNCDAHRVLILTVIIPPVTILINLRLIEVTVP
jgi:hypothetical protein